VNRSSLTSRLAAGTAALAAVAIWAPAAHGAVASSNGTTVFYTAGQGERNDLRVSQGSLLGQYVITFTDRGVGPIATSGSFCDLVNGVAMCRLSGVTRIRVNVRDKDDTVKVAVASSLGPLLIPTTLIGGRGADVLIGGNGPDKLKGNNGRDSLRGRKGRDIYLGGRGSDVIQALDGEADKRISCGDGRRDLVRMDKIDPDPKGCELGNRGKRSKRR
jgi:Ca2+-binding RTX toxin-like protein